ncbi:MAG: phage baseplate protein [Lachnospiraceae bacterium]
MALINKIYVFVATEDSDYSTEVSSHPVEDGEDLTDHVKSNMKSLKLTGEIVGKNYKNTVKKLNKLRSNGKKVRYIGNTILNDGVITSFNTSSSADIKGGLSFSMEIKKIRVAKSPYKKKQKKGSGKTSDSGEKQVVKKSTKTRKYHKIKKGDTLWDLCLKDNAKYAKYRVYKKDNAKEKKWLYENNPKCFHETVGDNGKKMKLPIVGKKLWVGNAS